MRTIVYIIPGHDESVGEQSGYKKIQNFFTRKGFDVIPVNINWKFHKQGFDHFINQFIKQYSHHKKTDRVIVLGYSFGSLIAFLSASITKPNLLILCSTSPYFIEDLQYTESRWLHWWNKNLGNNYSFGSIIKSVKSKTYILYGTNEHRSVVHRAWQLRKHLSNSRLFKVEGAKHNLHSKLYIQKLENIIKTL